EPVDQPDIDFVQIEEGKDLIFKAKVTVKPDVELGEYKGLNIEKKPAVVAPEEVEESLKRRQTQHAKLLTLEEGTVENGDIAEIDFEGFVDGAPFPGGAGENYDLTIGSGSFIPGFEEQLIGAAAGEERNVNVQFPDEYHSQELAGKQALFKVKVNMVKRKELAPLDDEFAKDTSEFATLDELRADILTQLMKVVENKVENDYRNDIVTKAAENASVDIPPVMIDHRAEQMVREFEQNLAYQGLNLERYMQYVHTTEEAMKEQFRSQAEQSVKTELVLEQIAKAEGIAVADEEVDEEIGKMAELYKQDVVALKQMLAQKGDLGNYRQGIVNEKTIKLLEEQNRNE
ncbi:MAG: trigger factor, partial [Peptococcaceae bacterium]|nr:trigger factor [Peptococcaceae bacterium]